jgi:hypothetical protein
MTTPRPTSKIELEELPDNVGIARIKSPIIRIQIPRYLKRLFMVIDI